MLKEVIRPFQYPQSTTDNSSKNVSSSKIKPKVRNGRGTLKRIWRYLTYSKGKLSIVLLMVFLSSSMALSGPFVVGKAIDIYIVERQSSGILFMLLLLAGVYITHSLSIWIQNTVMIEVAQSTVYKMRTDFFRHLHQLPISYFDNQRHGELMSRATNDMENVSNTLNTSFIQIVTSILTLIGTLAVMIYLSPLLTLLTMLVIPLMVFGMKWITNRTGKLFKEQQKNLGDMNGFIEETLSGQKIIKTFSLEKKVVAEFREKNLRLKGSGFWAQTFSGFIPKLMNGLNNLNFAIIAGVGGILALNQIITIGVIVIFAEYSRQFTRPLNDLANQFNTFLSAIAGAERVFDVLDEEEEQKDEEGTVVLSEVKGNIEFSHVNFSYERDSDTLCDVSFKVTQGQTVALVGPTGAGKTTVINLLSRFYDADSGKISIDGQDISKIKRDNLRQHMGFVLQDSFLFHGTIRENIRYGRLEANNEEVEEAAKQANAHNFITKLSEQYNTVLKHEGSGISQGQKQLISIARAILANPTILILDEATSSIDTITEIHIQDALQRLMKGRTSFVIAHRLNTIQKADQILVVMEGQVVERGSHDQLLQHKGYYSELMASSFMKKQVRV